MALKHAESVFDNQELRGEWWLPHNPDAAVTGMLSGNEVDGYHLVLSGELSPAENQLAVFAPDHPTAHPFVHGITLNGPVTLCDTFLSKHRAKLGVYSESTYFANLVLVGAHIANSQEQHFKTVRAKFSVLCDWINERPFKPPSDTIRDGTVTFAFPSQQVVYESDRFTIALGFGISGPNLELGQNHLLVEWEPQFVIETKGDELPWAGDEVPNHRSIIDALNDFLAVVTFGPSYPFDVVGYSSQFERHLSSGKPYLPEIAIYGARRMQRPRFARDEVLFTWASIRESAAAHFEKWFAVHSALVASIGLFLDSLERRHSYSPERFFNMVMALEGVHRYKHPEQSQRSEAHDKKVQSIVESVPEGYRSWVEKKLEHSHEPSLKRRLKDLVAPFKESFDWLIGGDGSEKKRKGWRNTVLLAIAESRNSLAHNLPEAGTDPGQRYRCFTILGELLMAMWLMREIGIADDHIHSRIKRSFYSKQDHDRLIGFLRRELRPEASS